MAAPEAEPTDPRPGAGLYLVEGTSPAGRGRTARGEFREVVPVHRLAYSFGWDWSDADHVRSPAASLVEIDPLGAEMAARLCA